MSDRRRGGRVLAAATALTLAPLAPLALSAQQRGGPGPSAFDALLDGMSCKQQKNGQIRCDYQVGSSLRFAIAGVGQEDVVVSFVHLDSLGDFFASVAPLHGCVVVKPKRPEEAARAAGLHPTDSVATFAYVSPRNGKVYRTWSACLSATKGEALRGEGKGDSTKPPAGSGTKVPVKPPI